MPEKDKRKGIICHSPVDFERIFLPQSFERKEREKVLRQPGGFGKNLEKELISSMRKGRAPKGKEKR